MPKRINNINKAITLLTLSDIFVWGSFTITSVLAGIYLSNKLGANTIKFIGIGTSIYLLTRGLFQIPIGIINDKYESEKDEVILLTLGILLMGIPFFFYPQISQPYHYYILQFVFGLGAALNVVNWRKLFALNLDKGKEGLQYGAYDTLMSLCAAIMSIIGGVIANMGDIYFDSVMRLSGVIILLGSIWVVLIGKHSFGKTETNN